MACNLIAAFVSCCASSVLLYCCTGDVQALCAASTFQLGTKCDAFLWQICVELDGAMQRAVQACNADHQQLRSACLHVVTLHLVTLTAPAALHSAAGCW